MYRHLLAHGTPCRQLYVPTTARKAFSRASALPSSERNAEPRNPISLSTSPRERRPHTSSPPFRRHAEGSRDADASKKGAGKWKTSERKLAARGRSLPLSPEMRRLFRNAHDTMVLEEYVPNATPPALNAQNIEAYLATEVQSWADCELVHERLQSYGIASHEVVPILGAFADAMREQTVFSRVQTTEEQAVRIADDITNPKSLVSLDAALCRLFFEWAAHPDSYDTLELVADSTTVLAISNLFHAADMSNPTSGFEWSGAMPRRKVIMHVGPTNSGKTHTALRALAASSNGVYAGPLRLLAREIWERLNSGQIVPRGMDADADAEQDEDIDLDVVTAPGTTPAVQKRGNKKFARACNLITGEETRIVDLSADLTSCTVEMLNRHAHFDVVVVDEIQMLADPQRGGAWTTALLGMSCNELHLCGEEAAVSVVEKITKLTGDELVVNRYERLSPLKIADTSLNNDWSSLQKGDCVVAFSRSKIFETKTKIEAATGLRCALAYGRLPPEVRSEQAAMFNNPNGNYDVMVGSDALGMGLNLRIKRVIFTTTSKWDGMEHVSIPYPQIKQIAGRAGRFGLHGGDNAGIVTTVQEADLQVVRDALDSPLEHLRYARLQIGTTQGAAIKGALPPEMRMSMVPWVCYYVSKLHPAFELQDHAKLSRTFELVDSIGPHMTVSDNVTLTYCPMPLRDSTAFPALVELIKTYDRDLAVDLESLLDKTRLMEPLKTLRTLMLTSEVKHPRILAGLMPNLEALHSVLVAYLWLSYRRSVSFVASDAVTELKEETEKAMHWCLERLSDVKKPRYGPDGFAPRKKLRPYGIRQP